MRVGIALMLYFPGVVGLSSTFILVICTLPAYSSASSSITGPIALQGPHQGAQKSTRLGVSPFKTYSSNSASVRCFTFSPAIFTTPIISFYNPKCYLGCLRVGILPTEPAYDKEKF